MWNAKAQRDANDLLFFTLRQLLFANFMFSCGWSNWKACSDMSHGSLRARKVTRVKSGSLDARDTAEIELTSWLIERYPH